MKYLNSLYNTVKYTFCAKFIMVIMVCSVLAMWNDSAAAQNPDQFSAGNALPLGGDLIKTDRYRINLWGIETPAEQDANGIYLRARAFLDRAIGQGRVSCRVFQWRGNTAYAQCQNQQEQDLAILLLNEGLAYTDRNSLYDIEGLKVAYTNAEQRAARLQKGVWHDSSVSAINFLDFENLPPHLKQNLFFILAIIAAGPLVGFLLIAFIQFAGFGRMANLQKSFLAKVGRSEGDMKKREKYVLASSLEGEILANKSKIEAFLTIYRDLLRDIRNPNKTPKYKQTGEILHERPSLTRMVYDANIDKLSLLGPSVVKLLSEVYAQIETSPKYITLEPDVSVEEAETKVHEIIIEAERFLPVMEKLGTGLNVITRNQK